MPSPIADAASQIAAKQISPVELTRACLDRIARALVQLRSFLLVTEERVLKIASEGKPAGPGPEESA